MFRPDFGNERTLLLLAIVVSAGCTSEDYEAVTYERPVPVGVAREVNVATTDVTDSNRPAVALPLPQAIQPEEALAFSGQIRVTNPQKPGLVYLLFYRRQPDGTRVTMANETAQCETGEDGHVRYAIRLKSPSAAGTTYDVELSYITKEGSTVFATGETTIP